MELGDKTVQDKIDVCCANGQCISHYEEIRDFNCGYAGVKCNGKWGIINKEGMEIVPCRYDDVDTEQGLWALKNDYLHLFDENGQALPLASKLNFNEGLAPATWIKEQYYQANKDGSITRKERHWGGMRCYGYVNHTGKVVIPFLYKEPPYGKSEYLTFRNGMARVFVDSWGISGSSRYDSKVGCIDKSGNMVFPFISDDYLDFSMEDGWIITYRRFDDWAGGLPKWFPRLVHMHGKKLTPDDWSIVSDFQEGLAVVEHYDKPTYTESYGFIDTNGKLVIPNKYDEAFAFSEGLAAVFLLDETSKYRKWGFIDRDGNEVIPPKYEWAESFKNGKAKVCDNDYKEFFIDKQGNRIG